MAAIAHNEYNTLIEILTVDGWRFIHEKEPIKAANHQKKKKKMFSLAEKQVTTFLE